MIFFKSLMPFKRSELRINIILEEVDNSQSGSIPSILASR